MFSKYIEIPSFGQIRDTDIEYGHTYILEEKIDGSNFRFGVDRNTRQIRIGSKNSDMTEAPQDMFKEGVNWIYNMSKTIIQILDEEPTIDNIIFFGEFLNAPKHNTIAYERIPAHNIILFDVEINGVYQPYETITKYGRILGLEVVPVLGIYTSPLSLTELQYQLNHKSILGNVDIEGVVLKSYDSRMKQFKKISPYMVKYVREEFKELNAKTWQNSRGNPVDRMVQAINKEIAWGKSIQHAKDDGKLEGKMQDMKILLEYLDNDLETQWKEPFKEELWQFYKQGIKRGILAGFPLFYKKTLEENLNNRQI